MMTNASVAPFKIRKILEHSNDPEARENPLSDDLLAVEEPLEIRLGYGIPSDRQSRNIAVTMRTPGHDFELATGFLFTEGIIEKIQDVIGIRYCKGDGHKEEQNNIVKVDLHENAAADLSRLQRNFYTTSSCGVCGKSSIEAIRTVQRIFPEEEEVKVSEVFIRALPLKLKEHQHVFQHTGGLHASALFDRKGNLILLREDIGRHNALDKLIGAALSGNPESGRGIPLKQHILLLSGRISFELVQKAASAGITFIAAIGAPSSLAVELAKEFDITLIGFLKEKKFNIYTGEKRILKMNANENKD